MTLPAPRTQPLVGHLGRWGTEPLALLDEGAGLGPVFTLRLWRRAVVGFRPEWNRLVLGDLETFRSRGSLSGLSPYLAGGLVQNDPPTHRARRAELNPSFHRRAVAGLGPRLADVVRSRRPSGDFDAVAWSAAVTVELLAVAFFGGDFPRRLLGEFLRPLDTRPPGPFLRRPRLFRRMDRVLEPALARAEAGTLAAAFAHLDGGVEEARVALGAAYDTTAHTMAWLLWHLAAHPEWADTDLSAQVVSETLRLYPAGWLGSRVSARDIDFDGVRIPRGALVFYSPYLTHRDPELWPDPGRFRPERFDEPLPAWSYVPFAAGERTCLGANLAQLVLRTVAAEFAGRLHRISGDSAPRAGLTLGPSGPLVVHRA